MQTWMRTTNNTMQKLKLILIAGCIVTTVMLVYTLVLFQACRDAGQCTDMPL